MAVTLLDINYDVLALTLTLLDQPSLRELSCTSWQAFRLVSPILVRNPSLSRNAEQVFNFCTFVLSQHLCSYIFQLSLSYGAFFTGSLTFPGTEPIIFASSLADVFEQATNVASLAISCIDALLNAEPRIANAICRNPPKSTLKLQNLTLPSMRLLAGVAGLQHLYLSVQDSSTEWQTFQSVEIDRLLVGSKQTLNSLTILGCIPSSLSSNASLHIWPKVEALFMDLASAFLHELVHPFPNLRRLVITQLTPILETAPVSSGQLEATSRHSLFAVWPHLHSFEGTTPMALELASLCDLRHFGQFGEPCSTALHMDEIGKIARCANLHSLSFMVSLHEAGSFSEPGEILKLELPLFSHLIQNAPNLALLSVALSRALIEIEPSKLDYLVSFLLVCLACRNISDFVVNDRIRRFYHLRPLESFNIWR